MTTASDIESATKTLNDLLDQREQLTGNAGRLIEQRRKLSYAALAARDKAAQDKLRKINDEALSYETQLQSIDAAVDEARQRLAQAEQAAALATDHANAARLREKLEKFLEQGLLVDDALWDLARAVNLMIGLLNDMHRLGQAAPTSDQFRVNAVMAIKTMLQELPQTWVRDFEFARLAPGQKKKFKDVCADWHAMIEAGVSARFGEAKTPEVA
jgi:hypothetical protein